jgi:hypothetical protein
MKYHDPSYVIVEFLSNPPSEQKLVWQKYGFTAKAMTVHILKEVSIPHYRLQLVKYENEAGQQRHAICLVGQDEAGFWQSFGASFPRSAFFPGSVAHPPSKEEMDTSQPWVLLGGGEGEVSFWADGHIIDHGFDVTRVRLISSNGEVLEDEAEDGFVIFLTDQKIQLPIEAELYNRSGTLVGKQEVFPLLPEEYGEQP